jgi:hypothetical protein
VCICFGEENKSLVKYKARKDGVSTRYSSPLSTKLSAIEEVINEFQKKWKMSVGRPFLCWDGEKTPLLFNSFPTVFFLSPNTSINHVFCVDFIDDCHSCLLIVISKVQDIM